MTLAWIGLVVWPTRTLANDPMHLRQGEPAPFDGDLLPVRLSVELGMKIETQKAMCEAESRHQSKLHQIRADADARRAAVKAAADAKRVELLTSELDAAGAWYRSPAFVAAVSVTATLLTATLVGYTWAELAR